MAHDRLGLLHRRTADLSAHSALLHLTWCHLHLRGERSSHASRDCSRRPRSCASVLLQLPTCHARGSSGVLRKLPMHRVLIVSVRSRWASSGSCCHGCRLCW
jgi:hypothetical protein